MPEVNEPVYPMFLLQTPNADCDEVLQMCSDAKLNFSQCFLDHRESHTMQVSVFYNSECNSSLAANRRRQLVVLMRDFAREPFGNWDVTTGIDSTRRMLILVYSSPFQVMEMKSLGRSFADQFLMAKVSESYVSNSKKDLKITKEDTPAFLISDVTKTKFLVWTNVVKDARLLHNLKLTAKGLLDDQMVHPMSLLPGMPKGPTPLWVSYVATFCACSFIGWVLGWISGSHSAYWVDPFEDLADVSSTRDKCFSPSILCWSIGAV
jgi:hypothetical protein